MPGVQERVGAWLVGGERKQNREKVPKRGQREQAHQMGNHESGGCTDAAIKS